VTPLGPTLTTDRLELRPHRPDDFDAFADLLADPTAMAFIGGAMSRPMAWRHFTQNIGQWVASGFGFFLVFERESGRLIGRVGTHMPVGWPGTEVGWALHGHAQGKGYATEAAARAMDWAVETLGWTEVIHCIDALNEPSMAVARRLGSRVLREAMLPEPISEACVVWGQTADEWRARRKTA
jgi:RimJ/RimL family protein N-acetyltransferase